MTNVKVVFSLMILLCVAWLGHADAIKNEVSADAFGYDAIDSTAAIQKALTSGARRVIITRQAGPWYVTPLSFSGLKDLEVVFEDGAEICAKRGEYKRKVSPMLVFSYCQGLTLKGKGRLRMWRDDYPDEGGHRHALAIHCCKDVLVDGLEIVESGGDGIYISTGKPQKGFRSYSENVVIRNVKSLRNFRQGISVIAVDGLLVENCELSDTCGTSPQAGIDFEPNNPNDTIAHCVMRNCLLERNKGYGVDTLFTWHDEMTAPLDITIENCISRDNEKAFHYNGVAQNGIFRSNVGKILVKNCIVREKGGQDAPYDYTLTWGAVLPDVKLRPMQVSEWNEMLVKIVDKAPGRLVELSNARFRCQGEYVLYADKPGEIAFKAQQLPVGAAGKPCDLMMKLARFRGEMIAELAAPAVTSTLYRVHVPDKGFYRLSWKCGWGSSIILNASSVPVAFSMFADRDELQRWMAPFMYGCKDPEFYFHVPEGADRFAVVASGMGGGLGDSARMIVRDPAGNVIADVDNMTKTDFYVSEANPLPGMWTVIASRSTVKPLNNFGVDLVGMPPLFFLSKEKYWTNPSR